MSRIQLEGILKLVDVDINPAIFQKVSRAVSGMPSALKQTGQAIGQAQGNAEGFNQTLRKTNQQLGIGAAFAQKFLQRMAQFAILLPIFATLNRAIQGGVKFMSQFEAELLNIVRIDPKNAVSRIQEISDAALDIGVRFGVSAIEVVKSVKVFVQAGESISSALDKAKIAAIAVQVSTLDLAQAQELLIGVQKQFGDSALTNIEILDKISKVEDLAAADAQDLADAFVTGGNAIAFGAKSFDDAIGIIAALREQTRKSGREIGTFLKTIATRMLAAGDSRSALEQLGVVVQDQAGNLRPLLAVLQDTKTAFDGLTEAEQVNAAKAIAGIRQFESFLGVLNSVKRAQELSTDSVNAQGTADSKLAIVQQKLAYQVDQTIAQFQQLAVELGNAGVIDFFKDALKAARGFAMGLEEAVKVANALGVAIAPLAAIGAFKLGQIAFGGIGANRNNVGKQSSANDQKFASFFAEVKSTLGKTTQSTNRLEKTPFFKFKPDKSPLIRGTSGKEFLQFQAASIAAGIALKGLEVAFKDATGVTGQVVGSLKDTLGAAQTGFQVAALLGPKAGLMVATFDLVINAIAKIVTALDERKKDFEQIKLDNANLKASRGIALDAAAGQVLTTPIIDAMQKALIRSGGTIDNAFFQTVDRAIKKAVSNPELVKQSGLTEDIKNLDLSDVLANPQFIKNLAAAHPEFERLNSAIKSGMSLSMQQSALYRDLTASGKAATDAVQGFVDTLKEVQERDKLRQQEAEINELLSQRNELLRTDIPLFQDEISQLEERERALGKFLDVAGATKADLENLASTNPSELGFVGNTTQASDRAKEFLNQIEEAFNNAGKNGEFNLTKVIDDIVKRSRTDTTFGLEDQVPITETEQAAMVKTAQEFVAILKKGATAEHERLKVRQQLQTVIGQKAVEAAQVQKNINDAATTAVKNAQLAFIKLGVDADLSAEDIAKLGEITTADFNEILKTGGSASQSLRNLIETFAGNDLQQAQQAARISSESFAEELQILDDRILEASNDLSNVKNRFNEQTGESQIDLEKRLGDLQIQRITLVNEAEAASLHDTLTIIKAKAEAEKEAAEEAKKTAKALDELAAANFALKNGVEDATRSFKEFSEQKLSELFDDEANAQSELKDAQQEVLSSTGELESAFQDFISSIYDFNDAVASASVEAGMLGIEMETLDGGLNTVSARVNALNQVFNNALVNANVSLKERISLEKQLAESTLSFLRDAQSQIVNAGLEVFGQSPEENASLNQGIQGLKAIADKLGGSFDAFTKLSPQEFANVSKELLSLPTQFRQQILDALRTLPSTTQIGGFSVEQLQNALGQVGTGINESVGLPAIADILTQEKEQITRLQELALQDADLQISQVIAAQQQLEDAKIQLEQSKINADRAAEQVQIVRDEILNTNDALSLAADQREKLTAELLQATDNAAIRQIEAQAREFANQVPLFTDISDKLLEVVTAIGGLQMATFSASEDIPIGAHGLIPNFAKGNISPKEAFGLLKAASREKRLMPAGAGLAVANTSEAIIPNFATGNTGSQIANSIEAINGTNAAVVAAITNSINGLLSRQNNGATPEVDKLTLDKLDSILTTLQDISLSNTTISDAVNSETAAPTTSNGVGTIQPIEINVNTNGRSVVTVAGLENLESALKEGIRRAQEEQADRVLTPVNSAVESIFRVLRERGLMSSFGQGQ